MQYVVSSGTLPNVTLNAGDTMSVFNSGTAVSTIVDFDATQLVYNGGTASDTIVDGGELYVSGGTTFNGSSVFNSAVAYNADALSGYIAVSDGGVTSGALLGGASSENVYAGGEAFSTTVNANGSMNIDGGNEFYTVINRGGSDFIQGSGTNIFGSSYGPGSATSDTINGGTQTVSGSAIYSVIENGGQQNVDGTATDTKVVNGGIQYVYAGAFETSVESGGLLFDAGDSISAVISSGGQEAVYRNAKSSNTTVKAGGVATIKSGGTDYAAKIGTGAIETIAYSGYSTDTQVGSGGVLAVEGGGVAYAAEFAKGAYLVLAPGAHVSGPIGAPTVASSGVVLQSPNTGPKSYSNPVIDPKLSDGGAAFVLPKGEVISATDHGELYVFSGGTAIATAIDGAASIFSGATESGGIIGIGGYETVSGSLVYSDTILAGGTEKVLAGAGTRSATIAGGTLIINPEAKLVGGVTFSGSGGVFLDNNTTAPTNVFSGFVAGDEIVVPYSIGWNTGSTVSVNQPGVVEIVTDHVAHKLNIAGATVGETDFVFGPGSILTKTAAPGTMTFLRPSEPASIADTLNWFAASRSVVTAPPAASVVAPEVGVRGVTGGWFNRDGLSAGFVASVPVISHGG